MMDFPALSPSTHQPGEPSKARSRRGPRGRFRAAAALTVAGALALSACGGDESGASGASGASGGEGGGNAEASLHVTTGFFPLTHLVEQVGGDHVEVTQITPEGGEPHHTEMTPKTAGAMQDSDLVVYLATMQPSVDAAVEAVASDHAWEVGQAVDIEDGPTGGDDHAHEGEAEHEGEHAEEEAGHEGHDHSGVDPHFWLDPHRYADAARATGEKLAQEDPDHAEDYRKRADDYAAQLEELDGELKKAFAQCQRKDLVVGHEAYAWFSDRYGFHQVGVAGINNEAEVSPSRLAEVADGVRETGATTIYREPLTPPDNAEALAAETDTEVAVLDPVAGLSEDSAARDYIGIMQANKEALVKGQGCE